MKLVMIHGIAQESYSEDELTSVWTKLLLARLPDLLTGIDVKLPFYGKELAMWTNGSPNVTPMGSLNQIGADNEELKFVLQSAEQMALDQGATDEQIQAATNSISSSEQDVVPMGTLVGRRLVGIVRVLEALSPAKGAIALQLIRQAYTYLKRPGAGAAVDELIRPHLDTTPLVVVSHSLGTVIAFKLLRELESSAPSLKIPLLVTLGSPLGLDAVKAALGAPRRKPRSVARWINFFDPADFVSLGKDLTKEVFADGIENFGDVDNATSNAHGITGYLNDGRVGTAIQSAFQTI